MKASELIKILSANPDAELSAEIDGRFGSAHIAGCTPRADGAKFSIDIDSDEYEHESEYVDEDDDDEDDEDDIDDEINIDSAVKEARLAKMQTQLAELKARLEADVIDVDKMGG